MRLIRRFVPRRKPLYLELDELAPHAGRGGRGTGCRNNPVPDPRDVGKFQNAQLPRPPSFNEGDMSDKPSFLQTQPLLTQRGDQPEDQGLSMRPRLPPAGRPHRGPPLPGSSSASASSAGRCSSSTPTTGSSSASIGSAAESSTPTRRPTGPRCSSASPPATGRATGGWQRSPSRWRTSTSRRRSSAWRTPAPVGERVAAGSWTGDHCLPLLRGRSPRWAADRPLGVELQLQNANSKHAVCKYAGVRLPGAIFVRHTRVARPGQPATA